MKKTNFYDVVALGLKLAFLMTFFGGTAYFIQVYNWSPWWMLFTVMVLGSVQFKTRR